MLCHTYGFLAVFTTGLALRRIDKGLPITPVTQAEAQKSGSALAPEEQAAAGAAAPSRMMNAVQRFNSQLERFIEVAIVMAVGILLASVKFESDVLRFVPVLFLLVRPLAVYGGSIGRKVNESQRNLMSWFGVRGIGSLYYLLCAINHGIQPALAERLLSIALAAVIASIIIHGISVTRLMQHYESHEAVRKKQQ